MPQTRQIVVTLTALAVGTTLLAARAGRAAEDPPPVPYGTQQALKLKAILENAPFMARSEDRVVRLKQERLRLCAQGLTYGFERHAAGQEISLASLSEPMAQLHDAWMSLCVTPDQKMPMLEFAMQLAESRERIAKVLFEEGRASAAEVVAATRDRLTAEIEMIECQRALREPATPRDGNH